MKKIAKSLVAAVLGWQVRRLHKKHNFKIIGIAGSMGKTSTKFALAAVLGQKYRVKFQNGNYNDQVSVPLVFFDQTMPLLYNPFAWAVVFLNNELKLRKIFAFDIVIVELGTDGPGQIKKFAKYLNLDIGILTAIAPEHMEYFKSLDLVADEELQIARFSKKLFVNTELCAKKYLDNLKLDFTAYDSKDAKDKVSAKAGLFSAGAAAAVGREFGLSAKQIETGIKSIKPVPGRMQILKGMNGSIIIDDTYNAAPESMKLALDALYSAKADNKIAVLGSMNELGEFSEEAHKQIGKYCDPKRISQIITIGADAGNYLAFAAEKNGCKVKTFDSPYAAGRYLKSLIKPGTIILAKGSQNGVFVEEAIKQILANLKDGSLLVRQSPAWLKIKEKQFSGEV